MWQCELYWRGPEQILFITFFLFIYLFIYVCVCPHATVCRGRRANMKESFLFLYYVAPGDWTQVLRLVTGILTYSAFSAAQDNFYFGQMLAHQKWRKPGTVAHGCNSSYFGSRGCVGDIGRPPSQRQRKEKENWKVGLMGERWFKGYFTILCAVRSLLFFFHPSALSSLFIAEYNALCNTTAQGTHTHTVQGRILGCPIYKLCDLS